MSACAEIMSSASGDHESPREQCDDASVSRSSTDLDFSPVQRLAEIPPRMEAWALLEYLQAYGFQASDDYRWRPIALPELNVQVSGHSTSSGHTYYHVKCKLKRGAVEGKCEGTYDTCWQTEVRLTHLRVALHDNVRKALGSSYQTYFSKVPFAQHMRPSGTTARLDAWMSRLAYCISRKLCPPWIAAATLQLLCAPQQIAVEIVGLRNVTKQRGPPSEGATSAPSEITAVGTAEASTEPTFSEPDVPKSPGSTEELNADAVASEPDIDSAKPPDSARSSAPSDFDGCPIADLDDDAAEGYPC